MQTVTELINDLFDQHRRPDGREYTYMEVSMALDGAIEPGHLSKLRTGRITNPGRETLLALCKFFKIPASYFFPELDEATPCDSVAAPEDPLHIALRSVGIDDPEVQAKLEDLIRAMGKKLA